MEFNLSAFILCSILSIWMFWLAYKNESVTALVAGFLEALFAVINLVIAMGWI